MPAVVAGACTIVSCNYVAQARVLARSFAEHHPGMPFFLLLVDRNGGAIDPAQEPFELIGVEDLGIPRFAEMAFRYNVLELNTAVKPFFLEYLFDARGLTDLVYLDPDILVLDRLTPVFDLLESHSVVLTPHITAPYDDDFHPSEITILQAGVYNLGFVALRASETSRALLRWWQERLRKEDGRAVGRGRTWL